MASDALELAESRFDAYPRRVGSVRDRHITAWILSLLLHGALFGGLVYFATRWTTPPSFGLNPGRMSLASRGSASAAPRINNKPTQEIKVVFADNEPALPQTSTLAQPLATAKPAAVEQPTVRLNTPPADPKLALADTETLKPTDDPDAIRLRRPEATPADAPKIEETPLPRVARSRPSQPAPAATPAQLVADLVVPASASSPGSNGANVDTPPRGVPTNPTPDYPRDAWLAQIEGEVLLRVHIAASGRVEWARVERSSGTPSLDESARSTVERVYRYLPATRGGVPVPYEGTLAIRFFIRSR